MAIANAEPFSGNWTDLFSNKTLAKSTGSTLVGKHPVLSPKAAFSTTAAPLVAKDRNLEALQEATIEAADVSMNLWLSYLFLLFYLAIAVGGVSHRDLFFENAVKLPFLSVDLPLLAFFWLSPLLFLVVHAYVLLHLLQLANKLTVFDAELGRQIADTQMALRLRRQLPSNIFLQLFAGPREIRTGVTGLMLWLIAHLSLIVAPVGLLALFQLKFLPYHSGITTWHRVAIVFDICLLWLLWPSIADGKTIQKRLRHLGLRWQSLVYFNSGSQLFFAARNTNGKSYYLKKTRSVLLAIASLLTALLTLTAVTYPGEWLNTALPPFKAVPWYDGKSNSWHLATPHELLVGGAVDIGAQRLTSPWSDRLVLPGLDVIDHTRFDSEAKIATLPESISLRERHLEGAILIGANLRSANFTAAALTGASLDDADLRDAKFDCAQSARGGGQEKCAQADAASFIGAQLQGASLSKANLNDVKFNRAQLQGATLHRTHLEGADFTNAHLEGATLSRAHLQGAVLDGAQLQGALLDFTELQGASLTATQLDHALLLGAFVWRADARQANVQDARVVSPVIAPRTGCDADSSKACDWFDGDFQKIRYLVKSQDISRLDPANTVKDESDMAANWTESEKGSPPLDVYEKGLAEQWYETGCFASGAPSALRGLLRGLRFLRTYSPDLPRQISTAYLKPGCSSVSSISETDKAALLAFGGRPSAAPSP